MKCSGTIFVYGAAFLEVGCAAFKVTPDHNRVFKEAIETSIKHPVNAPKEPRVVPMINVFDDDSYSPFIPNSLHSMLASLSSFTKNHKKNYPSNETFYPKMCDIIETEAFIPPSKRSVPRKMFGFDENPTEYWFNNRIHSLGNIGFFGAIHAIVAPFATHLIDTLAYNKVDVRSKVSKELYEELQTTNARVLDLCCGVGISTRALESAFDDAEIVVGVDTSPEMIGMARGIARHNTRFGKALFDFQRFIEKMKLATTQQEDKDTTVGPMNVCQNIAAYARGNAERTIFPDKSFDLVTIMYGFHEIPRLARYRILREARRILQDGGTLAVIDIVPEYEPSPSMLAGEPYVLEYQKNIHKQMSSITGFKNLRYKDLVPGHVGMWMLKKRTRIHRS